MYEDHHEVTTRQILVRFGITKHELQRRIEQEGWTPRRKHTEPPFSRARLIRRMLQALERQMERIEKGEVAADRVSNEMTGITQTLTKVLELDRLHRRKQSERAESAELIRIRTMIADRIDQLNRG